MRKTEIIAENADMSIHRCNENREKVEKGRALGKYNGTPLH
jgi:hypothetical protein